MRKITPTVIKEILTKSITITIIIKLMRTKTRPIVFDFRKEKPVINVVIKRLQ